MGTLLVTGGAGYIGSHMNKILQADHDTVVLDNLDRGHREAVRWGRFVEGDLADRGCLDRVFEENEVDGVIHFAASSLVGESVNAPLKYYRNNVAATVNLLEAMIAHDVKRIVFSSTAAVYGEPDSLPIREDHPKRPTNPYGRSKGCIEEIMAECALAHGLRYAALRYFNAAGSDPDGEIGEDHSPETHLIPLIFQAVLGQREAITIFGTDYPTDDGTCIRDYIHVNDLADAHVLALRALETDDAPCLRLNLGNGAGHSVRQVIESVERVTGRKVPVREGTRRAGDPARLVASSEAATATLGWAPRLADLDRIIETAWAWFEAHPKGYATA